MNEPGSAMKRTLVSRSAFIFAIRFFPIAATAAMGIAFSHALSPALNGAYSKLWIVYLAVFVAIACIGLPPFMLTHTVTAIDSWLRSVRKKHIGFFAAWLAAFAGLLVALFFRQQEFSPWVAAVLFIVQSWILLTENYLIIHQKFVPALVASVLYAAGFCLVHYLYLRQYYSLTGLFWAIAALGIARAAVLSITAGRQFHTTRSIAPAAPMPEAIRKQWFQLGVYDVSQVLFRWIDKLIVSAIIGPALFAVYLNGTQDVPFMATLLSAVGNSLLQQMAAGEKTTAARLRLVHLTGSLLARIVFPVFFFLFFFRAEFIVFVWSEKYTGSIPLFAISIISLLLRAYNYTSILQHLNQVKIINWGALLDLLIALALAYPLFLWKGLQGVAIAFMLSSFVQAAFYLHSTARLMQVSVLALIPWKQWLLMLIIFGTAAIGLHELLSRYFSPTHRLFLGFAGTVLIMVAALAPVLFSKKTHG